jgi:hypothetical protein
LISAAGQRYLRIEVRTPRSPLELLATIGHELQHAVEIARAPGVRNSAAMRDLYRRIGQNGANALTFETSDAQEVGKRVRLELMTGDHGQEH